MEQTQGLVADPQMLGMVNTSTPPIDFTASSLVAAPNAMSNPVGVGVDQQSGLDISSLRRMIAPLSKEQLIELLANAALTHTEVYQACAAMVKESPASRRLMIRNIAFSTKNDDFIKLFSQFGEVDDAAIVRDRDNKSKGYGFVTFRTADGVDKCFRAKELVLDGRQLLAKLAGDPYADFSSGGTGAVSSRNVEGCRRKLFVRNLADHTDSDALREIFSQYGPLDECVVVCNTEGRSRGYGFVTFQTPDAAIKAVQQPQRIIHGRVAFVTFATPTKTRNPPTTSVQPSSIDGRRHTRDTSPGMRMSAVHAANVSAAGLAAANLYNAYNPTAYPAVMPFYSHPPPSTQGSFGSQPVGLPMGNYDYMTAAAAAAVANPHRRY